MKRFIALGMALLMLAGCSMGGETTTAGGGSSTAGPVVEEKEYRVAYPAEATTLNYLLSSTTNEFALAANFIDTLIDYDKYGVVKPALAETWSKSPDGKVWTFNLRKGVKWVDHTGKEVAELKAQDFVDAMKYILTKTNESATANIAYSVLKNAEKYYNEEIKDFNEVGVKAKDDYTLEYTLEKETPYFESMLTYVCFFPANGKFLEEKGKSFGTTNDTLLYNGAYILESFVPQSERILTKNQTYWDKDNVFITKLNYKYNKEAATLAPEMVVRNELDYADVPSDIIDAWLKDPAKKDLVRPNRTNYYSYFYAFNFDPQFPAEYEPDNWKIVVNNVNFRKAMFHALDRKQAMITMEPYDPEYRLLNTITPKNFVDDKGLDYTLIGGLKALTEGNSFNEAQAKEFKTKAMEELNGKATFPVKVYMPYNSGVANWAKRAQVIEQQMEGVLGTDFIDILVVAKPSTGFLKDVRRNGNYAFLEVNWGPDYADPETYTDPFTPDSNYNFPHKAEGYKEANGKNKYENMVDLAKAETADTSKRYKLFADAEAFFINEAFVIPFFVSGGGFSTSRLNPFDSPYSPFGVASERFKGQKLLDKPMNTEEFKAAQEAWNKERAEALKNAPETTVK